MPGPMAGPSGRPGRVAARRCEAGGRRKEVHGMYPIVRDRGSRCRQAREASPSTESSAGMTPGIGGPSGRRDEPRFVGDDDELGAVPGAELGEDPAHVRLYRRHTHVQPLRVRRWRGLGDQASTCRSRSVSSRDRAAFAGGGLSGEMGDESAGDVRREQRLTAATTRIALAAPRAAGSSRRSRSLRRAAPRRRTRRGRRS